MTQAKCNIFYRIAAVQSYSAAFLLTPWPQSPALQPNANLEARRLCATGLAFQLLDLGMWQPGDSIPELLWNRFPTARSKMSLHRVLSKKHKHYFLENNGSIGIDLQLT